MAVLEEDNKKEIRQLVLKTKQWELAKGAIEILNPVESAIDVLGGSKYASINILLPIIAKWKDNCKQHVGKQP